MQHSCGGCCCQTRPRSTKASPGRIKPPFFSCQTSLSHSWCRATNHRAANQQCSTSSCSILAAAAAVRPGRAPRRHGDARGAASNVRPCHAALPRRKLGRDAARGCADGQASAAVHPRTGSRGMLFPPLSVTICRGMLCAPEVATARAHTLCYWAYAVPPSPPPKLHHVLVRISTRRHSWCRTLRPSAAARCARRKSQPRWPTPSAGPAPSPPLKATHYPPPSPLTRTPTSHCCAPQPQTPPGRRSPSPRSSPARAPPPSSPRRSTRRRRAPRRARRARRSARRASRWSGGCASSRTRSCRRRWRRTGRAPQSGRRRLMPRRPRRRRRRRSRPRGCAPLSLTTKDIFI